MGAIGRNDRRIVLTVRPETKQLALKAARVENRTISSLVENLLHKHGPEILKNATNASSA